MDYINSFRIFFLRKKTFNIIWEKIRTFEVLCVMISLKKFSSGSLIFCVRNTFVIEGLKCKFSKIIWFGGMANVHYILNRSMSNLVRNKSLVNNFGKLASFPNLFYTFKQNSPFLHSILIEVFVYANLIVP